jgi:putative phosphonate metabolism protein
LASPRFAIYFVPGADTALYRFGASVLGYDCYAGASITRMHADGLAEADWTALTAEPRTYGFHATLKAPFRLRDEFAEADLLAEMQASAVALSNIPTFAPTVELIGGFVALVPQDSTPALDRLAAQCVKSFDRFRAPMTTDEKARRTAAGLSAAQAENLERWGYPYVLDEFRFHMTLTGRIAPDRRTAVHALLREAFGRACGFHPIALDRLALVRQDFGTPFRVIDQVALHAN